jgi:hypothetical protein
MSDFKKMCECKNIINIVFDSCFDNNVVHYSLPNGCQDGEGYSSGDLGDCGGLFFDGCERAMDIELCVDCGKIQNVDLKKLRTQIEGRQKELKD